MKKFFAMATIALFTLVSCSEDDAAPTNPGTNNALLKKTIDTYEDGSTFTLNYNYNGNKLASLTDSDGGETLYTYVGDLITEVKYYEGETLFQTNLLSYDNNNKLTTHTMYLHTQNSGRKSEYTYNPNGTITVKNYIGDLNTQTTLASTYTVTINNNNITEIDMGTATQTFTYTNTFDPLSTVTGYNDLTMAFLDGGVNNIASFLYESSMGTIMEDSTFTYTYNANGYPATGTETTVDNEVITTQYFYE